LSNPSRFTTKALASNAKMVINVGVNSFMEFNLPEQLGMRKKMVAAAAHKYWTYPPFSTYLAMNVKNSSCQIARARLSSILGS
jgi:hypothetical protein